MGTLGIRVGFPMTGVAPDLHVPSPHVELIIRPGEDKKQTIPAFWGAQLDPIELKALIKGVLAIPIGLFAGKALGVSRDHHAPGPVGQSGRHHQEPRVGMHQVRVNHEPAEVGSPRRPFAVENLPVIPARRALVAQ